MVDVADIPPSLRRAAPASWLSRLSFVRRNPTLVVGARHAGLHGRCSRSSRR